jgi:hypothetical protein
MQATEAQYWQELHFLQVHKRFFEMIQMDMVVTFKNVIILVFE